MNDIRPLLFRSTRVRSARTKVARRARARRIRRGAGGPRRAILGRGGVLAAVMLLVAGGIALGVVRVAPIAQADGPMTLDKALGATRSVADVLGSHLNDGYYLGTPFGTIGPDRVDIAAIDRWDCRFPNGSPKPGVGGFMNCAGFVSSVFTECGADVSTIAGYVSSRGYRRGNDTNASKWKAYIEDNGFPAGRFSSKEEMLASGLLERGDLIYIHPRSFATGDAHIGFFWGQRSDEDLFWHSAPHGDGVIAGRSPGNMISRITPKGSALYYLVIKTEHKIDVSFDKRSADASFTDGSAEYSCAGAEYDIFRASDNTRIDHIVTDREGHASLSLDPGERYYALETKAPRGFRLDPDRHFFTAAEGDGVDLPEEPGRVVFSIVKRDRGGAVQTGADLSGATYRLVDARGSTQEATSDRDGHLSFGEVPLGVVTIREIIAPKGYRLDPEVHEYHITADDLSAQGIASIELADDFTELPVAFDLEIAKFKGDGSARGDGGHETPAEGVRFEIVSESSHKVVGTIETGADGFVDTSADPDLWFGTGSRAPGVSGAIPYDRAGYTVREDPETVPAGFDRAGDWTIGCAQMADGAKLSYILDDRALSSQLKIVKRDRGTGLTVPRAGFTFQILDEAGEIVTMIDPYPSPTVLDSFVTDDSGTVTLPERLPVGSYRVRETATAPPYLIGEDVPFEISDDYEQTEPVAVVCFADAQAMGRATILKTDAGRSPDDEEAPLADAEFDVIARDDVMSPDGTMRAAAGELVDHVTCGEDGRATTRELYLGAGVAVYRFVETRPPKGYVLDPTPHDVTLSFGDATTPMVSVGTEARDAPTEVIIKKTTMGTDRPLSGVDFALWNAADELDLKVDGATGALALRAPDARRVQLRASGESAGDETDPEERAPIEVPLDEERDCWAVSGLMPDSYEILVTATDDAPSAAAAIVGSVRIEPRKVSYGTVERESFRGLPVLLRDGRDPDPFTTDDEGLIAIRRLEAGIYRIAEVAAPTGYLVDPEPRTFTIGEDGMADGSPSETIAIENDFTKIEISKRAITDEHEIAGATLAVLDGTGDVIATWVSGETPHRIDRLKPGEYTLVEQMTPHDYDQTTEVSFTVEATGGIQRVTMHDEPIDIVAQVDKRQEIARPAAPETVADGDGGNLVKDNGDLTGRYAYSIDFRSSSSTWTDEFTVEESLDSVASGLATLESVSTPQARKDFDGKLNVWYRTNDVGRDDGDGSSANATLSDGHVNPWLGDPSNAAALGDDGRALDYTGWRLWAADLPADKACELSTSQLALADGERVTGVRFEYGRVEAGFTTRQGDWNRAGMKAPHDDLAEIEPVHEGESFEPDDGADPKARISSAPAIMNLRVSESYVAGTALDNTVRVDAYRNGGGEGLEAHDEDHVTQTAKSAAAPLPRTGSMPVAVCASALAVTAGAAGIVARGRRSGRAPHATRRRG